MNIKAVIFDLDGTLLDTIDDIADSMNQALENQGRTPYDVESYKIFVGRGVDELVKAVLKEDASHQSLFDVIRADYREYYRLWQNHKTKPYAGIVTLLQDLLEKDIKVCVLSNKPDADTVKVIAHYFPNYPFFEVYGQRTGYAVKPDPQSVLEIIDKLGYQKAEILYIGDTATDMQTAVNANLTAVGVLWGFRQKDELLKGGASFIISHPSELTQLLEKRF